MEMAIIAKRSNLIGIKASQPPPKQKPDISPSSIFPPPKKKIDESTSIKVIISINTNQK